MAAGLLSLAGLILLVTLVTGWALRERVTARPLGTWVGGVAGFIAGAAAGLAGFYLAYMAPEGQSFGLIDQGIWVIWLTGPIGGLAGALVGRRLAARAG